MLFGAFTSIFFCSKVTRVNNVGHNIPSFTWCIFYRRENFYFIRLFTTHSLIFFFPISAAYQCNVLHYYGSVCLSLRTISKDKCAGTLNTQNVLHQSHCCVQLFEQGKISCLPIVKCILTTINYIYCNDLDHELQ